MSFRIRFSSRKDSAFSLRFDRVGTISVVRPAHGGHPSSRGILETPSRVGPFRTRRDTFVRHAESALGRWGALQKTESETSRMFPRVESALRVSYATLDQLVVATAPTCRRAECSSTATDLLPVGSALLLELELPRRGGERFNNCRVVYVRDEAAADRTDKPMGIGIEFLDPREMDLARIGRLIADHGVGTFDSSRPPRPKPLKVLVVDDDRVALRKPPNLFAIEETRSRARPTAWPLSRLACASRPTSCLSPDVQMPRMDGWQLVRIVRFRPSSPRCLCSFARAFAARTIGSRATSSVNDFVAEPSRPEELLAGSTRFVTR